MAQSNSKLTIISMAVIASAMATLLHEGLGHGVTAWLRGDIPTELTSNHLSDLHLDHWLEAGGTLVNLFVGGVSLWISHSLVTRANLRYFCWILAALNLLPAAGYFLFSGVMGIGDWQAVINGLPNQVLLRIIMSLFGAGLYYYFVRLLAIAVRPFSPERSDYNTVGRLPYYAACIFSCMAGALDPLGLELFFTSTVAAAFGGSSGLMWADSLFPRNHLGPVLCITRQPAWWIAAAAIGLPYIIFIGRGIKIPH